MNLVALVDQKAAEFGDRVLAIFDDDTVTYAQVAELRRLLIDKRH